MIIKEFKYSSMEISTDTDWGISLKFGGYAGFWDNYKGGIDAFLFIGGNCLPYCHEESNFKQQQWRMIYDPNFKVGGLPHWY